MNYIAIHSEAPWSIDDKKNYNNASVVRNKNGEVVANAGGYDADLIADAPRLLKLLYEMMRQPHVAAYLDESMRGPSVELLKKHTNYEDRRSKD